MSPLMNNMASDFTIVIRLYGQNSCIKHEHVSTSGTNNVERMQSQYAINGLWRRGLRDTHLEASIQDIVDKVALIKKTPLWN